MASKFPSILRRRKQVQEVTGLHKLVFHNLSLWTCLSLTGLSCLAVKKKKKSHSVLWTFKLSPHCSRLSYSFVGALKFCSLAFETRRRRAPSFTDFHLSFSGHCGTLKCTILFVRCNSCAGHVSRLGSEKVAPHFALLHLFLPSLFSLLAFLCFHCSRV